MTKYDRKNVKISTTSARFERMAGGETTQCLCMPTHIQLKAVKTVKIGPESHVHPVARKQSSSSWTEM